MAKLAFVGQTKACCRPFELSPRFERTARTGASAARSIAALFVWVGAAICHASLALAEGGGPGVEGLWTDLARGVEEFVA